MLTYARTEIVSESARRTPPIEFLAGAWLVSYSSDNTRYPSPLSNGHGQFAQARTPYRVGPPVLRGGPRGGRYPGAPPLSAGVCDGSEATDGVIGVAAICAHVLCGIA